ncbi:MAG: M43 family zinc metalloprotease [Fulvivirga sp.]
MANRSCSSVQNYFGLVDRYPEYRNNLRRIDSEYGYYNRRQADKGEELQVPVVVHIIFKEVRDDISDASIKAQIDSLTNDFTASNQDITKVPQPFQATIGNPNISFHLAKRTPDGGETNGINRHQTAVGRFGMDNDQIKFSNEGGVDAWDTKRYLNIWVGRIDGGTLGYAQFHGGPAWTDGVVINTMAFGFDVPAEEPFNLGRTLTHEVGHYLNLSHIWGESRFHNCRDDDYVADTPVQLGPNVGGLHFLIFHAINNRMETCS